MSYILEALKKSQQERELGRVPTLDMGSLFDDDKVPAPQSHWGLLAVGLAAVAVVIALYAVLRTGVTPAPVEQTAVAVPSTPVAPAETTPATSAASPIATTVPASETTPAPLIEPPRPAVVSSRPTPTTAAAPRVEPAPRRGDADEPVLTSELDPWLERELQRQLDAEQAALSEPADQDEDEPPPRRRPERAPVPDDLVADIEAFKQQVRREQGIPPPPERRRPADLTGDPTKLTLTPQQRAQLPAYFMTVHVYDQDAAKRFVLINALKYREGEETLDGIRVERILPDGAVLSYMGNPFYERR